MGMCKEGFRVVLLYAFSLIIFGPCVQGQDVTIGPSVLAQSLKPSHEFAFDMFERLVRSHQGQNMILSVPAMLNSLTMLYEGAAGATEKELQEIVQFPADKAAYREALKSVQYTLQHSLGAKNVYTSGARFFTDNSLPITDTYKEILTNHYPTAAINQMDFKKPADVVIAINSWVNEATNGTIKTIISDDGVNANTELIIVNVEYFKGLWKFPFAVTATQDMPFHLNSRETIQVPTMYVKGKFAVRRLEHLTMIKLPFEDSKLSFIIALPKPEINLDNVEWFLMTATEQFNDPSAKYRSCEVFLPKFTIEKTLDLTAAFKKSGLEHLFSSPMNLTTMVGNRQLAVSSIVQKARVQVDELGSTASAAQEMELESRSFSDREVYLVNRPFLFMIQEDEDAMPLILGKFLRS